MLKEYIDLLETCNKDYFEWFKEKAQWFKPEEFTKREQKIIDGFLEKQGREIEAKQYYANSQLLAIFSRGKIKYAEGYAISGKIGIPFEHGFNVVGNKVLDVTWKDGIDYVGIVFPANEMRYYFENHVMKRRMLEPLLPAVYRRLKENEQKENITCVNRELDVTRC